MKMLIIRPDNTSEERALTTPVSLETLQREVGGLIEYVPMPARSGPWIEAWANEEGLILDLPLNVPASMALGRSIVGTVVLLDHNLP